MPKPRNPQANTIVRVAALALLALSGSAPACDTPVFRFAMYSPQWAPWPYVVFAFSADKGDDEADQVNERLRTAEQAKDGVPNLRFRRIDVADSAALEDLPAAVRKLHEARRDKKPFYVVVNPRGDVVYSGGLTLADAQALLDSPVRQELGRLMSQGEVVLLLLAGKDAKANQAAESTAKEAIRLVAEGRLDGVRPAAAKLGAAERAPGKAKPASPKASATTPKSSAVPKSSAAPKSGGAAPGGTTPKIALVKVSRSDAREAWLVRMLMRADQDLDEVADRPMVFPIYGRARALPPCIGEGITQENLLDDGFGLGFLAGPCSCEVKDGNPGTDLLTSIDWSSVSLGMARVYGDEDSADRLGDVTSLVPRMDGARAASTAGTRATRPGGLLPNLDPPTEEQAAAETSPGGENSSAADMEGEPSAASRSLRPIGILVACLAVVAVLASLFFLWPGGRSGR